MSQIAASKARKRCAVYCRVSTDERLDQEFNSIDAQKEAGLASIASQRAEGWIAVPDDYIDPGFSGGNMVLRPAIFQPLRPELFWGETRGKSHAVVGRSWPGIRVGQGAYRDRGSLGGKRHGSSGSYKFL